MRSLIDRLRDENRRILDRDWSVSRLLDAQPEYLRIRETFARHTTRNSRSSKSQDDGLKRRRERDLFLQFLLSYETLPARRITASDAPDFRMSLGRERIGVEMTELFVPHPRENECAVARGSILKEQEQLQDKIADRAMSHHARAGGRPLRVLITFGDTNFRKRDIEEAALLLAGLVPTDAPPHTSLRQDWVAATRWPAWLTDIYVGGRPDALRHVPRWDAGHGGFVPALEDLLPAEIRRKESKLPAYRRAKCNRYWLLVIISEQGASSFIDVTDPKRLYITDFDEIFVFWPSREAGRSYLALNCRLPRRRRASR